MATKKKKKKKTKTQRNEELAKIKRLLKKPEFRQQAVELLVTLDDPLLWAGVSATIEIPIDKHGDAQGGNTNMHLLAQMPDAIEGGREKKKEAQRLRLQQGSVLHASAVPDVRMIHLQGRNRVPWASLDELAKLEHLEVLELYYLPLGKGEALERMPALKELLIGRTDIREIPEMPSLEHLQLQQLGAVTIGAMPKLRSVRISTSPELVGWSGLGASDALERIELIGESEITDLDPLGRAVEHGAPLREVLLQKCSMLTSIAGLEGATALETFRVRAATELVDVSPLASCPSLKTIELRDSGVRDVSALRALEKLEVLDLTGCENVEGVDALGDHPTLRVVALGGTCVMREDVGDLLPWSTWAPNPHIPSLAARQR